MKAPSPLSGDPYMAMVVSLTAVALLYQIQDVRCETA